MGQRVGKMLRNLRKTGLYRFHDRRCESGGLLCAPPRSPCSNSTAAGRFPQAPRTLPRPSGAVLFYGVNVSKSEEHETALLRELSPREREVLILVVEGRTSREIARAIGVQPSTVDTYRSRIMAKLGIEDLPSLVRFAVRHGLIKP